MTMGQVMSDTLTTYLPPWAPILAQDNADTAQLYSSNPILLTDSNADGVPEGWYAYGGSTGYAHALVTDSLIPGKLMQVTRTANAASELSNGHSPASPPAIPLHSPLPGHRTGRDR